MNRLDSLTSRIVDPACPPGELWQAVNDLYPMLLDASGMRPEELDPTVAQDSMLPYGKAIAPLDAGRCLLDLYRTRQFARGVIAAIERGLAEDPTRAVHVLYAGCGPFATLLLPALSRFRPTEVRCTLLDLHPGSIEAVQRIVAAFGYEPFITDITRADATTYRVPADAVVDVLVVECLHRGLSSEPQVAITWSLVDQAGPGIILVPEEIQLHPVHVAGDARTMGPRPDVRRLTDHPIFVLSERVVREWGPWDAGAATLPARSVVAPAPLRPPDQLAIATTIRIRDGIGLADCDSLLTYPYPLPAPPYPAGTELAFEYTLAEPGITVLPRR